MSKMRVASLSIAGVIVGGIALVTGLLLASLPAENGKVVLPGLSSQARVKSDTFGVPDIEATRREDAYRVLGYLHARDRLFQMELMRRKSAGRLAELFGAKALDADRKQRVYQMDRAAQRIVADLPPAQRLTLQAYVDGVNQFIGAARVLPPEFLALRHRPEPWRPEDSILVELAMFQTLNGQEQDERMVSVMARALPQELVTFLTPDTDPYAKELIGGSLPRRFNPSIPLEALASLPGTDSTLALNQAVDAENVVSGSNNWVVAGSKTRDGRAMIASDMHLALNVPNIWYRADLSYGNRHIYGVTLPGAPAVILGGNDDVAWGFTNVTGDFLDLIRLETDPAHPGQYRTPQGWQAFTEHQETIRVKGEPDVTLTLRDSEWGPVSDQDLLGQPVAIKWTALEPHFVDLGLMDMDQARNTQQAVAVMNRFGGPPQNVVIADRDGHIAWTYMGRFPKRRGFDGLISQSWADGNFAWDGSIPPDELPRLFDPADGFIVTANNRTLGRDYPYVIGHNWSLSYRAHRIEELLKNRSGLTEPDLLAIQLDTRSEILAFYQQLALDALSNPSAADDSLQKARNAIAAWDGYMQTGSIGAPILSEFRTQLAGAVFEKVVAAGQTLDPQFRYAWREMEMPLRQLLTQRPKGVLNPRYQDDWQAMIVATLRQTVQALREKYPAVEPDQLTWGMTHPVNLRHPFSKVASALSGVLDMPAFDSDGCASVCVKVMDNAHGASERLVLSPSHPENALFHMPGGQSGHPLSAHYRDQQNFWRDGVALPLQSAKAGDVLRFVPR
ncbi:penicillin acylase family protein [Methylomonas sp. BW4-1]|uniref:penicillin acylase family protein n=1 Tax=Methylomonas sp. BW4-1 TaxID=3376685 RepID=UPI0040432FAA